jgi:hypothetical protein
LLSTNYGVYSPTNYYFLFAEVSHTKYCQNEIKDIRTNSNESSEEQIYDIELIEAIDFFVETYSDDSNDIEN